MVLKASYGGDTLFYLKKKYADDMISHARSEAPNECCGILATANNKVTKLYRTTNAESSPVRYNIESKELFAVHKDIECRGWKLGGIYHSHISNNAYPSKTDVERALWPESLYFIISLKNPKQPIIRSFQIIDGNTSEQELSIVRTL